MITVVIHVVGLWNLETRPKNLQSPDKIGIETIRIYTWFYVSFFIWQTIHKTYLQVKPVARWKLSTCMLKVRIRGHEMLQFWTLLLTVSIRNARQQVQGDDGWSVSEYVWHKYLLKIYNHLPLIIRPCVNKKNSRVG